MMEQMFAVVAHQPGDPAVLKLEQVPVPRLGPGDALVRVRACGVCGHDVLNRAGAIPGTRFPAIFGHEIAGEIVAVGAQVSAVQPGDGVLLYPRDPCRVCRFCRAGRDHLCRSGRGYYGEDIPGGYATHVIASERNCLPLPPSVSFAAGAILSCGVATALHALHRAGLRSGEIVVIPGASGGVGVHAVQIARLLGAFTVAVTSSEAKAPLLRDLGADAVVVAPDYRYRDQVRRLCPQGADVVLELTGQPGFESAVRTLAPGGRVVLAGNLSPAVLGLHAGLAIYRELAVLGSGNATSREVETVVEWVRQGRIRPVIGRELPLAEAATAHRLLLDRQVVGRLVLVPEA